METNEKAQLILEIIHELSGDLLEASRDGKIELSEALQALFNSAPKLLKASGLDLGN